MFSWEKKIRLSILVSVVARTQSCQACRGSFTEGKRKGRKRSESDGRFEKTEVGRERSLDFLDMGVCCGTLCSRASKMCTTESRKKCL